jgi:hypothetical protein
MNTAKHKAEQLLEKMYKRQWRKDTIELRNAKQCTIILVDEMLDFITKYDNHMLDYTYWEEVKSELEKL